MALTAPLNVRNYKDYIIGFDGSTPPEPGAQLGPGQTLTLVSTDTSTVTFTPDPTAQPDNEGVASVGSFGVNFLKVGGPVTVTATVTNADGSVVGAPLVDTITVTPAVAGVAVAFGDLFEQPLAAGVAAGAVALAKPVAKPAVTAPVTPVVTAHRP